MKYILLANSNIVDFLISIMQQFNFNWNAYNEHFKEMMLNLLQSNESSDVMLVCEDKTKFKAHKFVLNACSPVLQSIISDLPQNGQVIYLRGVLAPEMKSILEFMYLGQATTYKERMNDFLNVARSLEIKEISKEIDFDADDSSSQDQEYNENINPKIDNLHEEENIVNTNFKEEDIDYMSTKFTTHMNEATQYHCNKCDKQFKNSGNLNRHIKSLHDGIKFPCNECGHKATSKQHLGTHIKSVHEGIKFPCNICDFSATQEANLYTHKKKKHSNERF